MQKLLFIVLLPLIYFLFHKEEKKSVIPPTPTYFPKTDNYWVDPVFTPGAQKKYTVNGTDILVHTPDTTTANKMLVINWPGNGVTDSASAVTEGVAKKIRLGWDGKQPLCNAGDTARFVNITMLTNRNCVSSAIDTVIAWAYRYLKVDTSDGRTAITVLSQGGQDWDKVYSKFGVAVCGTPSNWRYKNKTKIGLFMSTGDYLTDGSYSEGWRFNKGWVYYGALETSTFVIAGNVNYDTLLYYNGAVNARKVVVAGAGHSATVWDSAVSTAGSSAANNWWRFAWDTYDCVDTAVGNLIPVNYQNGVCLNAVDGKVADSVKQLFNIGDYNPYRGTGTDNQTKNHLLIAGFTEYGAIKQTHGEHIKWDKRYRLKRIMAKFAGGQVDTMYLYWGTSFQTLAGMNSFDLYSYWRSDTAALTSLADARIITTTSAGWTTVWAGDDTLQYMMILARLQSTLQTSVVKLAFYGFEITGGEETEFNPLTLSQAIALDTARRQTLGNIVGANFSNFSLLASQANNAQARDGAEFPAYIKGTFPNDSVKYVTSNKNYLQSRITQNDSTKIYPFFTTGLDGTATMPKNAGTNGYRPENFTHYGSGLAKWTAIYGRNTTDPNIASPGYIKVAAGYDAVGTYGKNIWNRIDVLNEPNGSFQPNYFMLPVQYAAMHVTVADSIWARDSTMICEMGAVAGADIEYMRAGIRFYMMKKGSLIRSRIRLFALHKYPVVNKYPYDTSLCTKIRYNRIVQPMDKSYYQDNFRYNYQIWQELGYPAPLDINEDGCDKWHDVIHDPNCSNVVNINQYDTSQYNAPPYNGVSDYRRHAIYNTTAIIYHAESPNKYMAIYWWMNTYQGVKTSYQNSGLLQQYGLNWESPDSTYRFCAYYWTQGLAKRFRNWYCIQIIDSTNGGRHVSKWKKLGSADSSMIILNLADTTTATVNYTVTNVKAGAQYWTPRTIDSAKNDLNVNGTHSSATVVSNQVSMTAGFEPVYLVYEEQTLPDPPTCTASAGWPVVNLPETSVPLTSSVTGSVVSYAWSVQSGESGSNFSSPSSASTNATGLTYVSVPTRTYVFKLTVTDGFSQQGTCTVSVTVNRNYIPGRLRKKKGVQVN